MQENNDQRASSTDDASRKKRARATPKKQAKQLKLTDPNVNNRAVTLYRDLARWNVNWLQRREIALTVDQTNPRAMNLWESVIRDHLLTGKFKGNVKALLNEFDRLSPRVFGNGRNGR